MSKILTPQDWNLDRAMARLGVRRVPFDGVLHPNSRGYSLFDELALDPRCQHPKFVGIHELAHIELGHARTTERMISEMVGDDVLPTIDSISKADEFLSRPHTTREEMAAMRRFLENEDQIERDLERVKQDHEIEAHFIAIGVATKLNFGPREWDRMEEVHYIAQNGGAGDTRRVQAHVETHKDRLRSAGLKILSAGL